ncbi:hypothetical protein [Desulfofustis glycolicus]|nr:hypothetical protein [Desulfofustis glycolicus]
MATAATDVPEFATALSDAAAVQGSDLLPDLFASGLFDSEIKRHVNVRAGSGGIGAVSANLLVVIGTAVPIISASAFQARPFGQTHRGKEIDDRSNHRYRQTDDHSHIAASRDEPTWPPLPKVHRQRKKELGSAAKSARFPFTRYRDLMASASTAAG